jgi:anaerobic selenocysteine-containing dehydrogenase
VPWELALRHAADRIREIVSAHGPDAVAFYASGQLLTEEYYVASKLARGFVGTNNFDTNSRLCMASAAAGYTRSLGSDGPPASYADIDLADCFLLLGTNTADCHPVTFKRIRRRKRERPMPSRSSWSIRAGRRPPIWPICISRCGLARTSRC